MMKDDKMKIRRKEYNIYNYHLIFFVILLMLMLSLFFGAGSDEPSSCATVGKPRFTYDMIRVLAFSILITCVAWLIYGIYDLIIYNKSKPKVKE